MSVAKLDIAESVDIMVLTAPDASVLASDKALPLDTSSLHFFSLRIIRLGG